MPWHARDLQRLLLTLAVAAAGLLASWVGVSGTVVWSRQMLWLAIGIASIAIAGLGVMRWLLTAFRNVRVRQSRMADGVAARLVFDEVPESIDPEPPLVTAARMTHFHRVECALMNGKAPIRLTAARRKRLTPCAVCTPIAGGAIRP
jgi:hypothetical protein